MLAGGGGGRGRGGPAPPNTAPATAGGRTERERDKALARIAAENARVKPVVTRFKGLGEMSPTQLRETTMAPQTRRLVQMTIDAHDSPDQLLDMLLAKKRAGDRREWLETKGNLARV